MSHVVRHIFTLRVKYAVVLGICYIVLPLQQVIYSVLRALFRCLQPAKITQKTAFLILGTCKSILGIDRLPKKKLSF